MGNLLKLIGALSKRRLNYPLPAYRLGPERCTGFNQNAVPACARTVYRLRSDSAAHYAIRKLMWEAALTRDEPPERLSFKQAVNTVRRKLPAYGAIPPRAV